MKNMLSGKEEIMLRLKTKDRGIYVNDKLLINIYNRINDSFNGYHQGSNQKSYNS